MKVHILARAALLFAPAAMGRVLSEQFAYHSSAGYYMNNNMWGLDSGDGNQCTYIDRMDNIGVGWHTEWSWAGNDNNVKSYPYSGRELSEKKIVSTINCIYTKAEWMYQGDNVHANVAYDLFTAASPGRDISGGDYELMIWLGNMGGMHPIGSSTGLVKVDGKRWELFIGYNGAMKVFTFMAPSNIQTFETDIKPFFDHITRKHGFPATEQHLTTLQFGTEPFTGSNARFNVWYWMGEVN